MKYNESADSSLWQKKLKMTTSEQEPQDSSWLAQRRPSQFQNGSPQRPPSSIPEARPPPPLKPTTPSLPTASSRPMMRTDLRPLPPAESLHSPAWMNSQQEQNVEKPTSQQEQLLTVLRHRLDQLEYVEPLGLESLGLVQRLLSDLIQTTETARKFKTQFDVVVQEKALVQEQVSALRRVLSFSLTSAFQRDS